MSAEASKEPPHAPLNPKWIDALSPEDREEYEIVKAEDIEECTEKVRLVIIDHLGNSLEPGAVNALAVALAKKLRTAHDGGIQVGMDDKQRVIDRLEREAQHAAMYSHSVINQ